MEEKKKKFKKILNRIVVMYLSKEFSYRGQIFVWVIADFIKIVGLCFVWIAASKATTDISQSYVISYYLLLLLVSKLTTDFTPEYGLRNIVSGVFSNYLLKPFSYLTEYIGINLASNALRFIIFLPAFLLGLILASKFDFLIFGCNPYHIFLALVAVVLGFLINFLLGNILTLISFKIKETDGIRIFYYNIAAFLSGEYVPLIFLPFLLQFGLQLLPFRYTLSFPVEILTGRLGAYDLRLGFLVAVIWLILLWFIYKLTFKLSIKKYEAEGI